MLETRRAALEWETKAKGVAEKQQSLQARYQDTQALLIQRSAELEQAQKFLSKADDISHSEVIAMIEKINSLSFQLASLIAESTTFQPLRPVNRPSCPRAVEEMGGLLGKDMVDVLMAKSYAQPIYLQLALQSVISCVAAQIIRRWDLGSCIDQSGNRLLTNIHTEMFSIGEPHTWHGAIAYIVCRASGRISALARPRASLL